MYQHGNSLHAQILRLPLVYAVPQECDSRGSAVPRRKGGGAAEEVRICDQSSARLPPQRGRCQRSQPRTVPGTGAGLGLQRECPATDIRFRCSDRPPSHARRPHLPPCESSERFGPNFILHGIEQSPLNNYVSPVPADSCRLLLYTFSVEME